MNIILEQAKKDMAVDGVCDVGALMDEIERLANLLNKVAWHRGDEGLPDVPVLQPRYDALRQRVIALEESEKRWIQQAANFEKLAVIAQNRANREANLHKERGYNNDN